MISTDQNSRNNPISYYSCRKEFGEIKYSASLNEKSSIWFGDLDKSEFNEILLSLLDQAARPSEWLELRLLRKLTSLGHELKGMDISIEFSKTGLIEDRYIQALTFLKAINELLALNIQSSLIFSLIDECLNESFGKRKHHLHVALSAYPKTREIVKGSGAFSWGKRNPFLPILFFSRKGFTSLWDHGIAKYDLTELTMVPFEYWSEFLSPLELTSVQFFLELYLGKALIPDRVIRRKRRREFKVQFAA